jgi:hypothetical protein
MNSVSPGTAKLTPITVPPGELAAGSNFMVNLPSIASSRTSVTRSLSDPMAITTP